MKYYKVTFSDYSETVGKQASRAAMERDARKYCKMWGLSETVRSIEEITPEEYSRRTGQPIEEKPARESVLVFDAGKNVIILNGSRRTDKAARAIIDTLHNIGRICSDLASRAKEDRATLDDVKKRLYSAEMERKNGRLYFYNKSGIFMDIPEATEGLIFAEDTPKAAPAGETAPAPIESQDEPKNAPTSPATVSDREETPTEQATPEDVKTLLQLFRAFYNELYNREEDPDPATRAAADAIGREYCQLFDEYSQSRPAILAAFTEARRDYITSDREAAAFMLALEALTKAPKGPKEGKTTEPTPAPEKGQDGPKTGPTEDRKKRYIFRTFTGWTVYDGITSESTISAATDAEAEEIARQLAAGRAYSVNRLWTAEEDAPETTQTQMETTGAPEETAGDSQTTMDSPTEAPAEADPAGRYQTAMEGTSPAADHKTDGRPAPAADGQTVMEDGGKAGQPADGQTGMDSGPADSQTAMDGGKAGGRQTGMEGPEKARNSPARAEPLQTTTRDDSGPKCAKNRPYTPRPELSTIYTRGSPAKTVNPMTIGQGGQL